MAEAQEAEAQAEVRTAMQLLGAAQWGCEAGLRQTPDDDFPIRLITASQPARPGQGTAVVWEKSRGWT